jgi:2-polyprenyl-6-methoxyphenol hydroxylase-like FAD-dependent oxidoreductase
MAQPIIIAGAGPGGLALALALHGRGVRAVVYEAVAELRPLGVGINLLPHSVRVLHGLGLREALEAFAVRTTELHYYNRHGQLIWGEPRGIAAGYAFPQYSIHRGHLQLLLYREALRRLSPGNIHTGHTLEGWAERDGGIAARFRTGDGRTVEVGGAGLVAADGIHSAARRRLYPDEGPPIASGRILWRGISAGPPEIRLLPDLVGCRCRWAGADQLGRGTRSAQSGTAPAGLESRGSEGTLRRAVRRLALRLAPHPRTDRRRGADL